MTAEVAVAAAELRGAAQSRLAAVRRLEEARRAVLERSAPAAAGRCP